MQGNDATTSNVQVNIWAAFVNENVSFEAHPHRREDPKERAIKIGVSYKLVCARFVQRRNLLGRPRNLACQAGSSFS